VSRVLLRIGSVAAAWVLFACSAAAPLPSPTAASIATTAGQPLSAVAPATTSTVVPAVTPAIAGTPSAPIAHLRIAGLVQGIPPYDRNAWPLWVDEDHDCQDTRQEVLIAESRTPVTFETVAACRVRTGEWEDPYTGALTTDPGKLDIDHLVPLANAYSSGGWQWDVTKRRAYANDLAHPEHLLAVSVSANRSKGSQGPEDWKPPRHEYWCQYATDWISVKVRWDLTATPREWVALETMVAACVATSAAPESSGTAVPTPVPTGALAPDVQFANCTEARAAGVTPLRRGAPGYRAALDRDGDGIACE
jgi:hypothetical protein